MNTVSSRPRLGLVAVLVCTTLWGCSGGSSQPSMADSSSAQNGFTRPMTAAETAKGNVPAK